MIDERPLLPCFDCGIGEFTVYGPTKTRSPSDIENRRNSVMRLGPGRTFLRETDAVAQYFTLRSGWAFRFRRLSDGRRQILSFVLPGDPINMESLCFANTSLLYSVKSLTDIVVCTFSLTDMTELVHGSPEQQGQLETFLRSNVGANYGRLVDIGRRSALGRVAHLLLELEDRLKGKRMSHNGRFVFPARQEHLADSVGLTTVYVNRTLDRLRRLDVIEYNRDHMTILNMERLRSIAEEE